MLRTSTLLPRPTLEAEAKLSEYAEHSAILRNVANYERRKALHQHTEIPLYTDQCKTLKSTAAFRKLGTCKAQALLSKLSEAWQSFYALLRLKKNGKLPSHIRHWSINADVNGAVNILKVAVKRSPPPPVAGGEMETSGSRAMENPLLLRWNYHEWS